MSEVKRYDIAGYSGGMDEMADGDYVLAADFDLEHELYLLAKRQVNRLREENIALRELHGHAFEELQTLQAKLDTAMGLLRDWSEVSLAVSALDPLRRRTTPFLNTTSTEGKDHG